MAWKWKKNDLFLCFAVLLAALFLFLLQRYMVSSDGTAAVVSRNGKTVGIYPLKDEDRIVFAGDGGERNVLVIRDGKAYMEKADCPDQLCVKQGPVGKSGESIICLPHKLAVQIVGGETGEMDSLAR